MIMTRARSAIAVSAESRLGSKLLRPIALAGLVSAGLALSGCDPYSPGQRAVGGGLLGAGGGALLGGIAGGGTGAGIGALAGGALGAVGGAATTPNRAPPPREPGYYGY
jgi:hypothetical protein